MPAPPALPSPSSARHHWRYWRTAEAHIHEMSVAHGHRLALPPHVHHEDQIAFVLSGCRHFIFPTQCVFLSAGHALRIPAGIVHSSRDVGLETVCVNLYTTPGYGEDPADSAALLNAMVNARPHTVVTVPSPASTARHAPLIDTHSTVNAAARRHHMTREAYSRRFRRHYGISPQGFQRLGRLNTAKHLLRQGETLADTALQAGFSDQSHMGRLFRYAFGTTPRHYQAEY